MAQRKLEDFFRGKRKSREEHGEEERDDGAKPSDISTAAEPNASVESTSRANVSDSGLSGDVQPSSSAPSSAHSRTNNAAAENMVKPKKQKHAARFDPKWKTGRPWLIYDSASHSMFCQYCYNI